MREVELLYSFSAALGQIAVATIELRQACDTILTQSKRLAKVGHLKTAFNSLEDSIVFYETSGEGLKGEPETATEECTRTGELFKLTPAQVV